MLYLVGKIRQVFIQEAIVIIIEVIVLLQQLRSAQPDRLLLSLTHLALQIDLHLLYLLHLLSQSSDIRSVPAHLHHLLLLLQQEHLLLHHVHLHLNGIDLKTTPHGAVRHSGIADR